MEKSGTSRFAILIDADNVSEKYIKIILDDPVRPGSVPEARGHLRCR